MQVDEAHLAAFKSQGGFQVERAMAIRGERRTVTKPRWLKRGYYFVKRRPYRSPSARLRLKTGSKNHGRLSESSGKRKRFERKINRWGSQIGLSLKKEKFSGGGTGFFEKAPLRSSLASSSPESRARLQLIASLSISHWPLLGSCCAPPGAHGAPQIRLLRQLE